MHKPIYIHEDIHETLKIEAAKKRVSLRSFVEEVVLAGLASIKAPNKKAKAGKGAA